jgi:hypothetical protein
VPGASARAQYARRRVARERRTGKDSPQSGQEYVWRLGAEGEELLADRLGELLADTPVRLLHDRRMPDTKGNIDHTAVAPTGVFVIDAKNYDGPIEKRVEAGVPGSRRERLIVNGRDRTCLFEGLRRQGEATTNALEDLPGEPVSVSLMLCFVNGPFPQLGAPIVDGIPALLPRVAAMEIRKPGPLSADRIAEVTRHLGRRLHPASRSNKT